MKSKLFIALTFISVISSACDNTSKIPYQLKDTWGANGNWDSTSIAKNYKVTKSTPKVVKSNVTSVKVVQKPKMENKMANSSKPVTTEKMIVTQKPVENKNVYRWEKANTSGILKANYIKSIPDDNLGFSYGIINNTKVDAKFKSDYKAKLIKSIPNSSIISDKDETIKNKKSWSVVFNYDKDGIKIKQKQLFIPINKNIMLVNFVASEKGFSMAEPEFNSITSNLKL